MTDPTFELRFGPSGTPMPPSTPGNVITVLADGVSVAARPVPGGGGSGTPLTKCAWVDAAAPDGGNGFISLSQAFNALQAAIDAGATSIYIAPGSYGNIALSGDAQVLLCGLVEPGRNGQSLVSIGTIAINKSGGDVCLQNCSSGAITDTSSGPVIVSFVDATCASVTSSGSTVIRTGTQTQNMDPGFPPVSLGALANCAEVSLNWANCSGDIACTLFYGFRATISGSVTSSSTVNADHCRFVQPVNCTGSGTSVVKSSTFQQVALFDLCDAFDSTFAGDVSGDSGGGMVFRSCVLSNTIENPVTWDGVTELRSLAAGLDINAAAFVIALEHGQNGTADVQTGAATVNFAGNQRSVYGPDALSGDATFTIDATGSVAGESRIYTLDCWQTAHTITCNFGVTTIATVTPRAPGTGLRLLFQAAADNSAITFVGSRAL